jgi:hypothetical protein
MRLYSNNRNLYSFTVSLHHRCPSTVAKNFVKYFKLQLYFPKASTLNLTDVSKLCMDTRVFQTILENLVITLRVGPKPQSEERSPLILILNVAHAVTNNVAGIKRSNKNIGKTCSDFKRHGPQPTS